jgi:hypothetical protein
LKIEDFIKRAEELMRQADDVLKTKVTSSDGIYSWVDQGRFSGFRAASLSFIENLFGPNHPYYKDFDKQCKSTEPDNTQSGREILLAVLTELKGGWLTTTRSLVSAEIFADFLEMAGYLLQEKYKDAAAVITGSVLEEHLRQLCLKHGISITVTKGADTVPKKADVMNGELATAKVYNKLDQKNVTAWLDLRNKAAHGRYTEYTQQQVEFMHHAATDFMARNAV